jgi:hypothetical protein
MRVQLVAHSRNIYPVDTAEYTFQIADKREVVGAKSFTSGQSSFRTSGPWLNCRQTVQPAHRPSRAGKMEISIHNPIYKMCGLTRLRWSLAFPTGLYVVEKPQSARLSRQRSRIEAPSPLHSNAPTWHCRSPKTSTSARWPAFISGMLLYCSVIVADFLEILGKSTVGTKRNHDCMQ